MRSSSTERPLNLLHGHLPTSFSGSSVLQSKVRDAFASSATQHGGQETTPFTITTNLLHFGMTVVGLNYGFAG
jgi:multimeric flavodoxin WrbA